MTKKVKAKAGAQTAEPQSEPCDLYYAYALAHDYRRPDGGDFEPWTSLPSAEQEAWQDAMAPFLGLADELVDARSEVEDRERELKESEAELKDAQKKLEELDTLQSKHETLEANYEALEEERDGWERERAKLDAEIERLRVALEESASERARLTIEHERALRVPYAGRRSDVLTLMISAALLGREVACELVYRYRTLILDPGEVSDHPNRALRTRSVPPELVVRHVVADLRKFSPEGLRQLAARVVDEHAERARRSETRAPGGRGDGDGGAG